LRRRAKQKISPSALSLLMQTSALRRRGGLPHAKYGVEDMPDYVEPFTAYRAWQWDADGVKSLNSVLWEPRVAFVAKCQHATFGTIAAACPELHPVPCENCTCGMYAAINFQHLIDIDYATRGIHGEVSLWGRLYKHTLGWRAQYAYPKHFIVPPSMVPWGMAEMDERLKQLIAFDVDIYLQVEETPAVGGEKIPLWVKDYGYSQQGLAHLVDERKKWYSTRPKVRSVEIGDRVAIVPENKPLPCGISVASMSHGDDVFLWLFAKHLYRVPRKNIKWSQRNWRWEVPNSGLVITNQVNVPGWSQQVAPGTLVPVK
jgi:hypothetical protein